MPEYTPLELPVPEQLKDAHEYYEHKVNRRSFLKKAGVGAAAVTAAVVSYPGKSTHAQSSWRWKLAHSFGATAPVISDAIKNMAEDVNIMTEGKVKISVFGAGEIVPAFGVFDAVKEGSLEMYSSASYYWAGKVPATQFTCSVPFGMNVQQTMAWYYGGGGLEVWQEFYDKHGLMVFPCGNTGTQMGGWFRKEINSINDFNGLKMRMPGLGGKVIAAVGATVVLLAGPDIYPSLERGVIDATEWVGPFYDWNLGLHQAAKFYYSPGWHEPSTNNELTFNLKAWDTLPKEIQKMFEVAAYKMQAWQLGQFDAKNLEFMGKVKDYGIQFRQFPDDVLKALFTAASKVNEEVADSDPVARKVYDHYKNFQNGVRTWHNVNEVAYQKALQSVGAI